MSIKPTAMQEIIYDINDMMIKCQHLNDDL